MSRLVAATPVHLVLFGALSLLTPRSAAAYTIPTNPPKTAANSDVELLQKMSNGVAAISKQAKQALVAVSIYKTEHGMPNGMVDPFEFFFGLPGGGNGRRRAPAAAPQKRESGLGSGFFIDLKKGYIITNNHVVQGADELKLKLANGEIYEGKVVGRDPNTDVAVVRVKNDNFNRQGLDELTLGNSGTLAEGDFVIALGAPFGLESSLSFGVISAVGRGNLDIAKIGNFLQTDAAINPGNSGGPLIDMHGLVIGMNTAIYSRSGGYNGIGFAVPSNLVRTVAGQLINTGHVRRGYLGVYLQPLDDELRQGLSLPEGIHGGALVARVAPDGPAGKAGIEAGDVIAAVNNAQVKTSGEIVTAIGLMKPGSSADLTLYRDGHKKTVRVNITEHPDDEKTAANDSSNGRATGDSNTPVTGAFGLAVSPWSRTLKAHYGFESGTGVVVTAIQPDGPADRAGLRPGDVIRKVDDKKITSTAQFNKLTKTKSSMLVWIERAGTYYFQRLHKR